MIILNEHIKRFVAIWGVEYLDDLLDRGYEPILVSDGTMVKLSWRLNPLTNGTSCATVVSGSALTPV